MSSNKDLAARVVGLRPKQGQPLDPPAELGFHCPVCTYPLVHEGEYDERLQWSELNGFLWCSFCKEDYPAPLCMRDIERAIKIYLMCVKDVVERKRPKRRRWRPIIGFRLTPSREPGFREDLYRAREVRADYTFGEQIIDIADDKENDWIQAKNGGAPRVNKEQVLRSKICIEARQFHMSRLHPQQWGEKQTVDIKND